MSLYNKRILITAGPTWAPIDNVRVISNTASGVTGAILAGMMSSLGAKVTLLLGPACICGIEGKFRLRRFCFYGELKRLLARELKRGKYDAVVHSAAVCDYMPRRPSTRKIRSGTKALRLDLYPTQKLIDTIKRADPDIYLVGFKFLPAAGKDALIKEAAALARRSGADLVVANTMQKNRYRSYVVEGGSCGEAIASKKNLARDLCRRLSQNLNR